MTILAMIVIYGAMFGMPVYVINCVAKDMPAPPPRRRIGYRSSW